MRIFLQLLALPASLPARLPSIIFDSPPLPPLLRPAWVRRPNQPKGNLDVPAATFLPVPDFCKLYALFPPQTCLRGALLVPGGTFCWYLVACVTHGFRVIFVPCFSNDINHICQHLPCWLERLTNQGGRKATQVWRVCICVFVHLHLLHLCICIGCICASCLG